MTKLTRDYRESNRELLESFCRYMESRVEFRGLSQHTIRAYRKDVAFLIECLGPMSAAQARAFDVRVCLEKLMRRGLGANSLNRYTFAFRAFFKFLQLCEIIPVSPMLQIGYRRLPKRLQPVPEVDEIKRVIDAAQNPFERAVTEVLYSTGVRVSELCGIRIENIIPPQPQDSFPFGKILIQRGKGGKDRYVLYGEKAAKAIAEYQQWRPSKAGYLFETPERKRSLELIAGKHWVIRFYGRDRIEHAIGLGKIQDVPNEEAARAIWEKLKAKIPDCIYTPREPKPAGPYTVRAVYQMLADLGKRAGVSGIHPHAFRRAMASHMLADGADIRAIQELLGHKLLSTTQIYTTLTNEQVDKVYRKAHPHA